MVSCKYWYVPRPLGIIVKLTEAIVHNDFHQTRGLFPLFDGLEVRDMGKAFGLGLENGTLDASDIMGANGIESLSLANGVTH